MRTTTKPRRLSNSKVGSMPRLRVSGAAVTKLFGRYNYELRFSSSEPVDQDRLVILYGDNGSGKTTLLSLIFHLLSPEGRRGHRTYVAQVQFGELRVELSDGTKVTATREAGKTIGSYTLTIARPKHRPRRFRVEADEQNSVTLAPGKIFPFAASLSELQMDMYFLSDDRRMASDTLPEEELERKSYIVDSRGAIRYLESDKVEPEENQRAREVNKAVSRVEAWAQRMARQSTREGDTNVNEVYLDVAGRIAASTVEDTAGVEADLDRLASELGELDLRSRSFSELGIMARPPVSELLDLLRKAPAARHSVLYSVLQPYVKGLAAKLDAMEQVRRAVDLFVKTMNDFYMDKTVEFELDKGITIRSTSDRTVIPPDALSSGERQLLLLMCYTLFARERASVFIIDEPELSLNIKWQRKLLKALLVCASDSHMQFVIATHSIPLLDEYESRVVQLTSLGDQK